MKLDELVYDEEREFEKIIPKLKKLLMVKKTGEPVIVCEKSLLSNSEHIMLSLIGKFFAKKLGFANSDSITLEELHQMLKIDKKILSARLNDLRKENLVDRVSKGVYRISTVKLEEFLDRLLEKIEKGD